MPILVLNDMVIILALALLVIFACHRLRIPTIVGFLLTGMLAGPHGLKLVRAVEAVETLSEIGVILLLFTIGLEFSVANLAEFRAAVIVGGSLQMLLTIAVVVALGIPGEGAPGQLLLIGFVIATSSTAIVLKILQDRAEIHSPHGRAILGVQIFQDVAVVPMMLLIPFLAGHTTGHMASFWPFLAKGLAVVVLVLISARWLVPNLLYQTARLRDREVFLLSVVLIGLGTAWLTSSAGLSLALGGFLAGLIIASSEYGHRALGDILPFRDIFTSLFFVSIGMLLDVSVVLDHAALVLGATAGIILMKSLVASLSIYALGLPMRSATLAGLALAQVGEFSFVLLRAGLEHELLSSELYQLLLGIAILTMISTPFVIAAGPHLVSWGSRIPLPQGWRSAPIAPDSADMPSGRSDHLVVIGYGLNGRNLTQAASAAGIPYVIIEMNPRTVREEKQRGQPILYGDATQGAVLKQAETHTARVVVVAISDPAATRRIVAAVRELNPRAWIIARTRFVTEVEPLLKLGADEVIPEEFETSVEIFTRVLTKYLVPVDDIARLVKQVRADGYQMLRSPARTTGALSDLKTRIPDLEIATLRLGEDSPVVGKTLAEIELRKVCGIHLVAIHRQDEMLLNPGGDLRLQARDLVFVLGTADRVIAAAEFLGKGRRRCD